MNPVIALIAIFALLAQFAGWMVWRNLMIWTPVVAEISGSDYGELEPDFNYIDTPIFAARSIFAHYFGERDPLYQDSTFHRERQTEICYRYEDESGGIHSVQLTRIVERGRALSPSTMIWYDPNHPERFTTYGPGSWLLILIASLTALSFLFLKGVAALSALSLLAR